MWSDFKAFALKGNVIDLAVGVVIGTAFGKIVSSLVENIMMPLLGILYSGVDFTNMKVTVREADVMYGEFIQSVFDFVIIAVSVFFFVRVIAKVRHEKEKEHEKIKKRDKKEELLTEIRDLLKDGKKNNNEKSKKISLHIGASKNDRN